MNPTGFEEQALADAIAREESPLAENDKRPLTCEERLRAAEVQLLTNKANEEQIRQSQLAYEQACEDIKLLRNQLKARDNEITSLRKRVEKNLPAEQEYLRLTESLDFKVESKRLYMLVYSFDYFYLRFDRKGQIIKALSPEEYDKKIRAEMESS